MKGGAVNTQPVRIPEEDLRSARSISGLLGTTPGNLLHEAYQEYLANHRDEINDAFDYAKKYVASQDREGLLHLASQGSWERAKRAAATAPRPDAEEAERALALDDPIESLIDLDQPSRIEA
jgi:ABC-type cobalamin transport system ATPase subunit